MENKIKLQPVAVRSLGLPPEAAAQLGAIAQREESPDLDTENEFRAAADYLKNLQNQIRTAAAKAAAVPESSEGRTVFANAFADTYRGYRIFQYYIPKQSRADGSLPEGSVSRFIREGHLSVDYYSGHIKLEGNREFGKAIKLASDGQNLFALVENLTKTEASDYVAIRFGLAAYDHFVTDYGFAIAQIDSPEFADADGENKIKNLLLEDLTVVDGKVCGVYWDGETSSYLELPLKTEETTPGLDASDM